MTGLLLPRALRFGKGVYFADMVTKSANYCFTNKDNNVGLLLLCEVALGDMNELYQVRWPQCRLLLALPHFLSS